MDCPDCGASELSRHSERCDVARCSACGLQRLTCECSSGRPTVWDGEIPGVREVERFGFGLANLNDLYAAARDGRIQWDADIESWTSPAS